MIFTVIDLYDVFRTDLFPCTYCREQKRREMFSTCPGDYLSKDGFYL